MYKIYSDNYLILDNSVTALKVISPKLALALNAVSSLEFTLYPDHPYFDKIQKLKSVITVYDEGVLVFKGRVLNERHGVFNEKKVECENDLAYLLDSVQRPYEFQGTPADLFRQLINSHNSQVDEAHRFKIGNITVTDPNDYIHRSDTTYQTTWDAINEKLIKGLGGYIWVRYEADGPYIDYLEDFNILSNQTIEFGKNLLNYVRTSSTMDVFTVIVPMGARDNEGDRVDITSVNDGKDYLEHPEGIAKYGRITKMMEWEDVTIPNNLKTKAQRALDNAVLQLNTIEISAADLSAINLNINSFKIGCKVRVVSKYHGVDDTFLVNRLFIDMLNPSANILQLGAEYKTFTDKQNSEMKTLTTQIINKTEDVTFNAVYEASKQFKSDLQSTSDAIMTSVSEQYYIKAETDQLIEAVSTTLTQTSEAFELRFESFSVDLDAVISGTDAEFENIRKYIRFEDGKILLGEVGNSLELRIANDRIQFMQNNSEVAYFSNNKLFVTDGEYTNSLQLGKFAFLPRTNGNLSFKKVRD